MPSIDVISNNKIKEIIKLHQKKYRDKQNLFIAEGRKALEECLNSGVKIRDIIALKNFDISAINRSVFVVDEDVMKKLSTTDSVCEVMVIGEKKQVNAENFSKLSKIALLDSISDPGNLGTIIRSAAAFGVDGIILFGNCVDLYSPKVIRSCAGNFFKVPVLFINSVQELQNLFKNHYFVATALSKKNNISLDDCTKIDKILLMFGSEANGLDKKLINIAKSNIKLNMAKNVESLNLGVCASIIFYETFK